MKTETTNTIDILSEDFYIPDCNVDLQELIDQCIEYYNQMPYCRKTTRDFRHKVNQLVDEYNSRRGMKIYNHI